MNYFVHREMNLKNQTAHLFMKVFCFHKVCDSVSQIHFSMNKIHFTVNPLIMEIYHVNYHKVELKVYFAKINIYHK